MLDVVLEEAQSLRAGEPLAAFELLETEAARVAASDPERAGRILADAAATIQHFDDERAHDAARRSIALSERAGRPPELVARLVLGSTSVGLGRPAEARRIVEEFLASAEAAGTVEPRTLQPAILTLFWLDEYPAARELLEEVVRQARARGHEFLAGALDTLAAVEYRMGRWPSAHARSLEALRLARRGGQRAQAASCLTTLARIEAARGEEGRCRRRVDEAVELAGGEAIVVEYALSARGLLELTLGRHELAAEELERLMELPDVRGLVEPAVALWVPDLVEAYSRSSRLEEAAELLDAFERRAVTTQRVSALAAAARARGLLASSDRFDRHFDAALAHHVRVVMPFERARTELAYGERLRRARRRAEARPHLQAALGAFERLGAGPWAARARRELGSTTSAGRPSEGDLADVLTPHELQVAALIGRGATNREAAATLFVSTKTIEYHLASIYRKLDVRSRTELAWRVALSERRLDER